MTDQSLPNSEGDRGRLDNTNSVSGAATSADTAASSPASESESPASSVTSSEGSASNQPQPVHSQPTAKPDSEFAVTPATEEGPSSIDAKPQVDVSSASQTTADTASSEPSASGSASADTTPVDTDARGATTADAASAGTAASGKTSADETSSQSNPEGPASASQASSNETEQITAIVPAKTQGPMVIESASATTSPDNVNSGYMSYIITALGLVGVLLLCMGLWNCTSSLIETGVRNGLNDIAEQFDEGNGSQALPYGLNENNGSGSRGRSGSNGSSLSVPDALDLDLDLYSDTIGSAISASDYAGTPSSMRSYVLSVVHTDSDHNSSVVASLNAAAAADDPRPDIETALSECDQAINDLNSLQVPSDLGGTAAQDAQSGKEKAVARWQAIQAELKLFDTEDDVSYSDLQKADNAVADATNDAGTALVQALTDAANSR